MSIFRLFKKLLLVLRTPVDNPAPPLAKGASYDILFSVWNVFRNREQRHGFIRNGLSVHWVGNHFPPKKNAVTKRSFAWMPFVVLVSASFLKTRQFGVYLSMWLFNLYSGSKRLNTKLVWAYVEMNTILISRAKRRQIPIVLDNPIAHMDDYYALKSEYEQCGFPWSDWCIRRWVAAAKTEYALADWFNVGSLFVKESLVARGIPADRIIVNHTGVDTSLWQAAHRTRRHTPNRPFIFVFSGAVIPRKGIRPLMQAWKAASPANAELWICGSTGAVVDWDKICGGLPSTVKFLGRMPHKQLVDVYSRAFVYVLPSLLEGLARSGLEAMSAGLPVIITRETGLTDFVTDGIEGWIVPARDVNALADRILWCIGHQDIVRAAGEAAFHRMRGQSFNSYGDQCAAIAKSIIATGRPFPSVKNERPSLEARDAAK